jgi:hypothetical protein
MKSSLMIRRLVPWVLGLYFIAQIVSLAPLVAVHLQHIYQGQVAIADDIARTGVVDHGHERYGHHQHGTTDPGDQCCTLHHHLAAVLSVDMIYSPGGFESYLRLLSLLDLFVGAEPGLLDRPPKLLSV